MEFSFVNLACPNPYSVMAVYQHSGLIQCGACGLRFRESHAYASHLDAHYLKNRAASAARKMAPSSRRWFSQWGLSPTTHVKKEEPFELQRDDHPDCALCGERFAVFLHPDSEEWCFRGAQPFGGAGLAHHQCASPSSSLS